MSDENTPREDLSNALKVLIDGGIVECEPGFFDELPPQSVYDLALKKKSLVEELGFYEFLKQPAKFQWNLRSMLVLLTTLSIAIAGYANSGHPGIVAALLGAWLMLVGVGCIWFSRTSETATKLTEIIVGFIALAVGLAVFGLAVYQ